MPLEDTLTTIQVDGRTYQVKPGTSLLEACLSLGFDVPYFCYHPAMGSVGSCRLCAVRIFRDSDDTKGRIVMSCMEPVSDGMIISVSDPEVKAFRAAIIESLMNNHPHDCPVCDEGGECHLQDMTVMTGHNYRRYHFRKRSHCNQYLGPFLNHEMNRCIACYRCVRFYRDYAGGRDFGAFSSGSRVYFGRAEAGVLESEFSGNLAEVCPTGVFTDKTLKKHYTRKWDLSSAPSICVHCSLGCNTFCSERYGTVRRISNRYNGAVNGYFLCDRGRYGYEYVNGKDRLTVAAVRNHKKETSHVASTGELSQALKAIFAPGRRVIGIGSPRASLEANHALMQLAGSGNFYHGVAAGEHALVRQALSMLRTLPVHSPSLRDMEQSDAVLILGEDLPNTAPMAALALRQAVRNKALSLAEGLHIPGWHDQAVRNAAQDVRSPLYIASCTPTRLDDVARRTFHASPESLTRMARAVAAAISNASGKAPAWSHDQPLAEEIGNVLKEARAPLIVTGVSCGSGALLAAAGGIAHALAARHDNVRMGIILPECNSMGLAMMDGEPFEKVLERLEKEKDAVLVVLENDLFRRAEKSLAEQITGSADCLVVLDSISTLTTEKADILLPVGAFSEITGTFVSCEGRAQRFYHALPPKPPVKESWRWLAEIKALLEPGNLPWNHVDDVLADLAGKNPSFERGGQLIADIQSLTAAGKIPRQTKRYSGRTAIHAHQAVGEPGPLSDNETPLAFSMEGSHDHPPPALVPFYWAPGWNSVQALQKYTEAPKGQLKGGDPGIRLIEKPFQQPSEAIRSLEENAAPAFPDQGQGKEKNPETSELADDEWLIVPLCSVFGSEELSSRGDAIMQRIPAPYLIISEEEAGKKGLAAGRRVELLTGETKLQLTVRTEKEMAGKLAALSLALPGMPYISLPAKGTIRTVVDSEIT